MKNYPTAAARKKNLLAMEAAATYSQKIILKKGDTPISTNIITSSRMSYDFLLKFWDMEAIEYTEHFCAIYLNQANLPIAWAKISEGGITATIVDMRVLYSHALLCGATAIIVAHNHPSGSLKPSRQDEELTKKAKAAGDALDIRLLDHLIITKENYYSFADEGQMY